MTIIAFESNKDVQSKIREQYDLSENRLSFFPSNSSLLEVMQLQPDLIIQDYEKGQIIDCRNL